LYRHLRQGWPTRRPIKSYSHLPLQLVLVYHVLEGFSVSAHANWTRTNLRTSYSSLSARQFYPFPFEFLCHAKRFSCRSKYVPNFRWLE
jgi:hypothetical protein